MDKHRSSTPERHNSGIIRDSSISNRLSQVDDDDAVQEAPAGHETASIKLAALSNQGSGVPRASSDIGASPSNILAQVFSRFSTRNLPEPPPPPDGGLKAWTQVAMSFLVFIPAWGYANSFGAFQAYYTEVLPQDPSTISWIGGIQFLLSLIIGTISGRLLDAGFFLPTFAVGMILQVLGIFLMSLSTEYWQLFLSQGVLSGIGAGLYFTPAVSVVNTYFDKRRALAIGLATTGNSAGGIVYPLLVRELIPTLGFPWATRVIGFLNLGLLSIALVFMRARLPPRKSSDLLDLQAFKEPAFTLYLIATFFLFWANYYTFYYIGSFGTQALGMPLSSASILVIIINGVGLPFRILTPMVADRLGNVNVIVVVSILGVIVAFTWLAVHNIPAYYAFTVAYGIAAASFQCLFPSTVSRITPRLDTIGTRLGMAFGITAIASLTGPSIGGRIQTADGGGFRGAQIWAAVSTLISALFFIILRLQIGGLRVKLRWPPTKPFR